MSRTFPLIDHLQLLLEREDRAALAALRRGLGHEYGVVEMYPHVVPFIPEDDRHHRYYFLVAALFALHPDRPTRLGESMGRTFARIGEARGNMESVERRFVALLGAHAADVGEHLRHAISLARSNGVGVDYAKLLNDLLWWSHPERRIQLQWARDFWHPLTADAEGPATTGEEQAATDTKSVEE
jgi:CRISPR system Cascade subunit CasB